MPDCCNASLRLDEIRALCDTADRSCPCSDATQPWHAPMDVRTDSIRAIVDRPGEGAS